MTRLASSNLPATLPPVREATMPEIRKILALVEGHFDEAKGIYTGSWCDQKVADELDLPRALIAKVREDSGLRLKIDPEILALGNEIKAPSELLADLRARLDALAARHAR